MHIIKRGNTDILNIKASGTLTKRYMDASVVQMSFTLTDQFDFAIGDSVIVHGQRFYLNKIPLLIQQSSFKYDYTATFEARYYDLSKVIFCQYDENNELTEGSFSLMATANVFLDLIIKNANRDQSGWEAGTVDNTKAKNLTFSANTKCLTALAQVAEAFELEYWEENQVLHLTKKGSPSGLTFSYGKGNGFYNIARSNENDAAITTVVYARGGTQNIPNNYRNYSSRLKMPASAGVRLTANTELYGYNEEWLENNDIFPKRLGTVSAINGHLKFKDADIDFDVNQQLMPGVSAKITFQTGQLAGYELELTNYNHATKEFTLKVNADEKALEVPSAILHAVIGDQYVLHDIIMPASYISAAEQELYDWALAYLQKNSIPRVSVQPTADRLYFKKQAIALSLGDTANIVAPKLGINRELRILGYTQDINDRYNYISLEFAETALPRAINRIVARAEKVDNAIRINNLLNPAKARNNWRTTQELTTMLDTLRAEMLLITVAGAAYDTDVTAIVNDANFVTTAGQLQHAQYTDNGGAWAVDAAVLALPANVPYYVYFKASQVEATATIVLSEVKIGVEDIVGFYHFPYGIISSIIDGTRVFTSTKGYTRITGDNVTTGKISATNGTTVLDLDNAVFDVAGNAGISGNGALNTSIRFWAGAAFADRNIAPFRVDHAGRLFATNATISGHIEATSGSIAGVSISAGDQFSLNGTKVKILPDKGLRVLDGGYLSIPKVPAPIEDMPIGEYCLVMREAVGGITPVNVIARLGDLLDVDTTGDAEWVLYKKNDGTFGFKAASGGPGPDVYSKSEINAFFGGVTPITGYNKANWDAAYSWGNHATAGYAMANGSNAFGVWNISSSKWGGITADFLTPGTSLSYILGLDNTDKGKYFSSAYVQAFVGLNNGSTLTNSISGNALTSTTAYSADRFAGIGYEGALLNPPIYLMGFNGVTSRFGVVDAAQTKAFLGLPASGGYDLQGVTNRGATTTNSITVGTNITVKGVTPFIQFNNFSDVGLGYIQQNAAGIEYYTTTGGHKFRQKVFSSFFGIPSGNGANEFELGSNSSGGGSFYIYDINNGRYRLNILNNGYVGIGTYEPLQKFVVSNNGALGLEIYDDSANGAFGIQVYNRSSPGYGILKIDASQVVISTNVLLANNKMTAKHIEATAALRVPKVELDPADMVPGEYYLRIREL
ncbi:hypothetical protein [Pedobacter sp.]|uniref:hypothetical protein n=1 Tax=Pedobacter sp. TaxID=1411316 RepID=UPI00396CF8BF